MQTSTSSTDGQPDPAAGTHIWTTL
ncbi:MAG: hypothetical protein QOG60_1820, partial [Frankiaceae bacterium]|nr:hypothetical protein [Frankiaceae bacterium]